MKRLLACLALCASLSASAQGDCELFNIQELASENLELHDSIAALNTELDNCNVFLEGVDLNGTNFDGAYLVYASITESEGTNVSFNNAQLTYAIMPSNQLEGADFSNAHLQGVNFTGSHLQGANFTDANMWLTNMAETNLDGADLSVADIGRVNFTSASLIGANLTGLYLQGSNFFTAHLGGADLAGATIAGANMRCLVNDCPSVLPSGYICEPDPDCSYPYSYRIVPE